MDLLLRTKPWVGQRKRPLVGSEVTEIQRFDREACELDEKDSLTRFDVGGETGADRALYTTKKFPGATRSGLVSISMSRTVAASVNRLRAGPLKVRCEGVRRLPSARSLSSIRFTNSTTTRLAY
jgi:hypothetical protein